MKINLHGIEVSYIMVHLHDIWVITRDLSFALVLGNNADIMLVPGYKYDYIQWTPLIKNPVIRNFCL